jgi:hypothetical protein
MAASFSRAQRPENYASIGELVQENRVPSGECGMSAIFFIEGAPLELCLPSTRHGDASIPPMIALLGNYDPGANHPG